MSPFLSDQRWGVDWVRVIANLQASGLSLQGIADAAMVSKSQVIAHASEDMRQRPEHSTGERLIALWCEVLSYSRTDLPMYHVVIAAFGEAKTMADWVRDPRVKVSATAIRWRMNAGMSAEEALTAPKLTHRASVAKKPKARRNTREGLAQLRAEVRRMAKEMGRG